MANFESYKRMFQAPEWLDLEEVRLFEGFFGYEVDSFMPAFQVAGAIGVADSLGHIGGDVQRVLEFGSGDGPGLIALDQFAKSRPGEVTVIGSEIRLDDRRIAYKIAELLENVNGVEEDGFEILSRGSKFDVVVANMFGSIHRDRERVERFVTLSVASLSPGGVAIINSDIDTMDDVEEFVEESLPANRFRVISDPDELPSGFCSMPHIFLLGDSSAE